IAKHPESISEYAGNIMAMRLLLSIAGFILLLLLVSLLNIPNETKYLVLLFGTGFFPGAILLDWAFQGVERMEFIALSRLLTVCLYIILLVSVVKGTGQLGLVPVFLALSNLTTALFLIYSFKGSYKTIPFCFNWPLWKKLFMDALPLGISLILVQMIYYIDTVVLGFIRTEVEIGYYNAAYKIIIFCVGIAGNFFESIFPLMSRTYYSDRKQFRTIQTFNVRLMMATSIPLVVGGTLLSSEIIATIYGDQYSGSVAVFKLLIWVPAIIYMNTVYAWGLWAMDRHPLYLKIVAFQLTINIVSNVIFIPYWGIYGAAWATILSELSGFPLYYLYFSREIQLPILASFAIKPLLASLVMAGLLWLLKGISCLSIYMIIFIGIITYIISMLLLKGINKNEFKQIRDIFAFR
ncbi:MAG: flippase, partial [Candidatus Methanoperedens sp.]